MMFETTKFVPIETRETMNYGLNFKSEEEVVKVDYLMTPEMQKIVDALELQKDKS